MKRLILLMLIVPICCFSQVFEGEIIYQNIYKSKNAQLKDEQLGIMMGTTQNYYFKGDNYKSVLNGQVLQWQLYLSQDKKLYSKMSNSETVFWNDVNIQGDEILSAVINKNVTTILGYKCDELILTCKSGIQKYYYNSKLNIEANKFVNHKLGNWYDFVSRSNALPLKTIIENAQFTLISIAVEIKPMKLEAYFFKLPINVKTEKSPY
jgi:hypothetical protein